MKKKEAKKRIEKLKKVISYHRYLYHVLNKEEISADSQDSLKHELYQLEQKFPEFITPDSPTQRVAGEPLEGFKKVKHRFPMLSIEDIFSEKELLEWVDYLKRLIPNQKFEYFTEIKIDGFAVTLIYENGSLSCGATRGNGKTGEDVTQNLKTIESIPLKLEIRGKIPNEKIKKDIERLAKRGRIEIRGEVYMDKKAFEKLNKQLKKRGESTYSNPRNLAAGSIRQLDSKLAAARPLNFLGYDVITDFGQKTHTQEHQILPSLGFKTNKGKECKNLNEIISFWKKVNNTRDNLPFQIDGVVISVNRNSVFKKLGTVGKSPRAIRAFKFSPKRATTNIKNIKLQVGRTGAVTPVAILEPVKIGGVTISRATLHNEDEIKKLGVKIGDTVVVARAGDVIPNIIKVLPDLRTGKERTFQMPKKCPICDTKLKKTQEESVWRCPNLKCSARQRRQFYHFVSRGAFDIEGLGPKIINRFIEEELISDPTDLFKLKEGDVAPLKGFGPQSAKNLISAIELKKEINLTRFIYALGIRNVGEETALNLSFHFGSIEKLKIATIDKLEQIQDIGPIVAKSIYEFFSKDSNLKFIEELKKVGVKIKKEKIKIKTQKLKGISFVLTGALKSMNREVAKRKIRELGGNINDSVSSGTDYVILGEKPGSKFEKAKKIGIKTIKEKEFIKMIKR